MVIEMSELELGGLMHATMVFKNKDGETVFSMKRKDDYDSLYYIFEKNEDIMSSEEKEKFAQAFELIAMGAATRGIPLYDSRELMDGVAGKMQVLLRSKETVRALKEADKTGEVVLVRDVDITVFDHGTGRINNLTVGISVPPVGSENIEKIIAELSRS